MLVWGGVRFGPVWYGLFFAGVQTQKFKTPSARVFFVFKLKLA